MQETKLVSAQVVAFQGMAHAHGYRCAVTLAARTEAGGLSGGTAVLWRPDIVVQAPIIGLESRVLCVPMYLQVAGWINVCSVYGVTGQDASANGPVLQALRELRSQLPGGFLAGGDFNLSPAALE
jgi:hypothetical protein